MKTGKIISLLLLTLYIAATGWSAAEPWLCPCAGHRHGPGTAAAYEAGSADAAPCRDGCTYGAASNRDAADAAAPRSACPSDAAAPCRADAAADACRCTASDPAEGLWARCCNDYHATDLELYTSQSDAARAVLRCAVTTLPPSIAALCPDAVETGIHRSAPAERPLRSPRPVYPGASGFRAPPALV